MASTTISHLPTSWKGVPKVTNARRTLIALPIVVVLAGLSPATALAHRGKVFGTSFGGPGSGAGQLALTPFYNGSRIPQGGSGLGVDSVSQDVYVADTGNRRVDEFTSGGSFVRAWGWGVVNGASELQVCTSATGCQAGLSGTAPGEFESPAFIAVDDTAAGESDVYVAEYEENSSKATVQKFTASGGLVESWGTKGQIVAQSPLPGHSEGLGRIISGVVVDSAGDLVVGSGQGIFVFGQSTGAYLSNIGEATATEAPNGFAVDGSGNYYYDLGGEYIQKFDPSGGALGILFETLSPKQPGLAFFPSGLAVSQSGELFVDEGNAIQVVASSCVPSFPPPYCAPTVTFRSPALTEGAGLAVDSQHEVVYIAEIDGDKIESIVPEPPAAPLVEVGGESVSNVSADSGTMEAVISPRSEPDEEPTSYRFQYTSEEQFQREGFAGAESVPVPDGQLAPNYEADRVSAHVQDLAPATVYHYRVVAENAVSRKEGKPAEGERGETGEEIAHTFTTQDASGFALPDGRAWELVSPPDKHGALLSSITHKAVIQAATDGGAVSYFASAPTESRPPGNSNATQVLSARAGGSWGSRDISTPREVANGSNAAGVSEEYRFFSTDLSLAVAQPFGESLAPLSSEASGMTPFLRTDYTGGDREDPCVSACYQPLVTGAPGFANVPEGTEFWKPHCAIGSCSPSFEGSSPDGSHIVLSSRIGLTEEASSTSSSLYEWAGGRLQLVSVLPESEGGGTASAGVELGSTTSAAQAVKRNTISADGSRIVWSTGPASNVHLYVRDTATQETFLLGVGATFQAASSDGSRVFFVKGGDLYLFEAPLGGALSAGHVTDLAPGGAVIGAIPGASGDGSSVYLVANGVLTSTPNAHGEGAVAGDCGASFGTFQPKDALCDLYVWHDGSTRLVAVLSGEDARDWGGEGGGSDLTTARVSPNGEWLAFMSERPLTGYDNRDVASGERDEEVFLYGTAGNGGTGQLVCASCDPTGARPRGISDQLQPPPLGDQQGEWAGRWLAANIPAWTSPLYQSRYLSNAGRLFFNSSDVLAPSDTNGTVDVYEFEPSGVGDCTTGNSGFSSRSGGCLGLISSGTGREESAFLDASESGGDVFFLTSAQLSLSDTDAVPDVYDARVDGGFPAPQPPPACEGDACQSPVAAPNDPTPGSLTYRGPGNPVPLFTVRKAAKKKTIKCTRGKQVAHGKCVKTKRAKRKKASKTKAGKSAKAGRSGNERGARS